MPWIKRNLIFVISGAVGLVLLGVAGWYLYATMQDNQAASDAFQTALTQFSSYKKADPFPNVENLQAAKEDQERVAKLAATVKNQFPPFVQYSVLTDQEFKDYMVRQVDDLQRKARQVGTDLPDDYYFSFDPERKLMKFPSDLTALWIEQMEAIKGLAAVAYAAHVNYIERFRRPPLAGFEGNSPYDAMPGVTSVTNKGVIRTPYEIAFQCFSSELAGVLEGLMSSTNCYLIKNISVGPSNRQIVPFAEANPANPVLQLNTPPPAYEAPVHRMTMEERYGLKPGTLRRLQEQNTPKPPPSPKPSAPKPKPPPTTVLTEQPLRVVIFLEILTLEPSAK
jgi:hypothetical protein